MKKHFLILCAGLALTSSQPAFAYYPWEMWQASRALEAKDYAGASQRYQEALKEQPNSPQAHYNLGECLYREKKYPQASAEFKKAMELSSTQLKGKAAYNLGNTLFREQKLEEALEAYKTALRWDEIDDDARYNIQVILDMLKKKNDPKKDKDKDKDKKDNKDKDKDKDKDKGDQGNKGKDKDKSKNNDDKSQAKNDDKDGQGKDQKDKSKGKGDGKQDDKDKNNQDPNKPKDDQQGKDQNQNGGQQPQGQNPQQNQQNQGQNQDPSQMSRQEAERLLNYFNNQEKRKMQQGKGKKAGIVGLPSGETW